MNESWILNRSTMLPVKPTFFLAGWYKKHYMHSILETWFCICSNQNLLKWFIPRRGLYSRGRIVLSLRAIWGCHYLDPLVGHRNKQSTRLGFHSQWYLLHGLQNARGLHIQGYKIFLNILNKKFTCTTNLNKEVSFLQPIQPTNFILGHALIILTIFGKLFNINQIKHNKMHEVVISVVWAFCLESW